MIEIDSGNFLTRAEIDDFFSLICRFCVGGFCSSEDDTGHLFTGWPKCFYRHGCGFTIRMLLPAENLVELGDGR